MVTDDLGQFYDGYDRVEEAFDQALGASLGPRGPEVLYDVIGALALPAGAFVVDAGCGEGRQARDMVHRFGFTVAGIDPRPSTVGSDGVAFRQGTVEAMPVDTASADLVLCREVLYHVRDLVAAFTECRRVLKPVVGRVVVYQLFDTDRLEPREAAWFWNSPLMNPANADPAHFERCVELAGLAIESRLDLRSETIEWAEEQDGKASRELLAAARLLRAPERYVARFGQAAYDIRLHDAFWHVYRMIGKLTQRLYVLRVT